MNGKQLLIYGENNSNGDEDGDGIDGDNDALFNLNIVDSKSLKCLPPFIILNLVFYTVKNMWLPPRSLELLLPNVIKS